MAITRLRAKTKPKSPKNSPKNSPKAKASPKPATPQKAQATPEGTPSKKAKLSKTPTKPSPLKKEITPKKAAKPVEEPVIEETDVVQDQEEFELPSDSDSEDDDLQGFKSDEDVAIEAEQEFKSKKDQINNDIKTIMSHQVKTQLTQAANKNTSAGKSKKKTGTIYIGRLPRGFEEYELKKYFEQFGKLLNLRLSRNKKTGNSKHYAFIEFESYEVAKIAAETMNNYLIFGHIIKVSLLTKEKQELFKNANTKFKAIPWLKINKVQNDRAKKLEKWESLQKKNDARKLKKFAKLKELGIDYTL